ncbi:cation:proton antiporter [Bacillus sp. UNC438CL73TsuS30]|uniref:cation:proton antiporter n=1 Tax=Bacillus sp. UNC438CL73TsuS30 TaxID=1340434 RepID=UPI00047A394F|nr:cation:proton antiporter [Bacillus sp. UNC438CL73TsuS30]
MKELDVHSIFVIGFVLIMLAAFVTAIAKKLKQPYPIALVLVGALIGLTDFSSLASLKNFITQGEVFHFVIVTLFLPALLGEASLKLPFPQLKNNKLPILALAFGATLISYLVVGFSSYFQLNLSIQAAFVFAALMSATDPVSVLSIFKSVGVNKKLAIIVEGESLFNDGMAVVLYQISGFYLLTYLDLGWEGLGMGIWIFVKVIVLGLIVGGALGYGFSILTKFYDDYPLEIIFSIILFYGSYLLAESMHGSGVIAVVVAAIILGNFGARIGMSPTTRLNIGNFWDVAALLANSVVFLMVGLEITRIGLSNKWGTIIGAILIVLIARSVAVYLSLIFNKDFPWAWKHIINWGGLKGSLSIALVLSLPYSFKGRDELLVLTFFVVLFSLVVQGLTVKPLITVLGVKPKERGVLEYEHLIAKIHRYDSAIEEITRVKRRLFITEPVSAEMVTEYQGKKSRVETELQELYKIHSELKEKQRNLLSRQALYAEHEAISHLHKDEVISNDIANLEEVEVMDLLVKLDEKNH